MRFESPASLRMMKLLLEQPGHDQCRVESTGTVMVPRFCESVPEYEPPAPLGLLAAGADVAGAGVLAETVWVTVVVGPGTFRTCTTVLILNLVLPGVVTVLVTVLAGLVTVVILVLVELAAAPTAKPASSATRPITQPLRYQGPRATGGGLLGEP